MSKSVHRTAVPAVIGRRVVSAYIFSDERDAHGVVLSLDDGSDLSIEFNNETKVVTEVLRCGPQDDEAKLLKTSGLVDADLRGHTP